MYTLVQWATILSPIIAVLIAIWASKSSAKDTAKKLVALEVADENNRHFSNYIPEMEAYHQREDKKKDMTDNCDFWKNQVALLDKLVRKVDEMSKNVSVE